MTLISDRLSRFKPSLTVKISQTAREMTLSGEHVISLSSGEPDFDTPMHIKKSAIEAIDSGFTKYTQVDGIPELKEAICNKFINENGLKFSLDQITVGAGGKHVIYNLFMSTLNRDDEVIIPSPYWVSYPDMVNLAGGKSVIIETNMENNFKINPKQLNECINESTKWFIINSPGNPTGAVYNKKELLEISKVLMNYPKIQILSDDIYEHIIYGEKFLNILNVEPKLYDRTFIVNGVSKAFSMTGWRIGYGAGNREIVKSISKIQSQSTTNPCSISQVAAKFALQSDKKFLVDWIEKFKKRKDFLNNFFNSIDGFKPYEPSGAFYLFVNCGGFINKKNPNGNTIKNDLDFAEFILQDAKVAVVPGVAFGKSPYFRISYATSLNDLTEACNRIKKSIKRIS
ncbi:MAG: pyridoxal phosphate-dependent aminotransferase [Alphaproteobacteria bacterium]